MDLQPHQKRVADERMELAEKIFKLNAFMHSEKFDGLVPDEQRRLERQSTVMQEYCQILVDRIAAF